MTANAKESEMSATDTTIDSTLAAAGGGAPRSRNSRCVRGRDARLPQAPPRAWSGRSRRVVQEPHRAVRPTHGSTGRESGRDGGVRLRAELLHHAAGDALRPSGWPRTRRLRVGASGRCDDPARGHRRGGLRHEPVGN